MSDRARAFLRNLPALLLITYCFFLGLKAMGDGMKVSFADALQRYLAIHASEFTELVSFAIGIVGTSVVQSSSTVTSMTVTMVVEGIMPLTIGIGIVHGANLGTSVTSSLVAFAANTHPMTGNVIDDLRTLLFAPRLPGFHRAVSTAVVHGLFNAIMVTLILLTLELPFGFIHHGADWMATTFNSWVSKSATIREAMLVITPDAYTKPVVKLALHLGVPGWALVIIGFLMLFWCLKAFSGRMSSILMAGSNPDDAEALGRTLLGTRPLDTFVRGLVLTMLVQSSSATTSMVVPLAGMGFFTVRQIFPFIMGANIGTCLTAMMAATAAFGTPGFHAGMTIALCHFLLNTVAVILVASIPGLYTSVVGATEWLADRAEKLPAVLLLYLASLSLVVPMVVYALPTTLAASTLGVILLVMLIGPHFYLRGKARRGEPIHIH